MLIEATHNQHGLHHHPEEAAKLIQWPPAGLDIGPCPLPLLLLLLAVASSFSVVSGSRTRLCHRSRISKWLRQGRLKIRDTIAGRLMVRQGLEVPTGEHEDALDAAAKGVSLLDQLLA